MRDPGFKYRFVFLQSLNFSPVDLAKKACKRTGYLILLLKEKWKEELPMRLDAYRCGREHDKEERSAGAQGEAREQSGDRTDLSGNQGHFCDKFRKERKHHVVNMSVTIASVSG